MSAARAASAGNAANQQRWQLAGFRCSDGTALPTFLRVSSKAKRWRLQLSHQGELEVVLPQHEARRLQIEQLVRQARDEAQTQPAVQTQAQAQLQLQFLPQPQPQPQPQSQPRPSTGTGQAQIATPPEVLDFIDCHRAWIERAVRRTSPQREAYQQSKRAGLPTHLDFPLANELWTIAYEQTAAKSVSAKPAGLRQVQGTRQVFALRVLGNVADEELCRRVLIRFTTQRAKATIPSFAEGVCRSIGACPRSISVNNCRTAWGICTAAGDIRIDRRVLFLPTDLARQIVLHEAAHLQQHNHSKRFYQLLYSFEGASREAEKAVKQASQFVPAWFIDGA
ncbi:MAG: M48 family metallopeptidase [Coriobacteriales bacterium]|nr:M48 family metallopeptidase [Coriobacteriales bacterium]